MNIPSDYNPTCPLTTEFVWGWQVPKDFPPYLYQDQTPEKREMATVLHSEDLPPHLRVPKEEMERDLPIEDLLLHLPLLHRNSFPLDKETVYSPRLEVRIIHRMRVRRMIVW